MDGARRLVTDRSVYMQPHGLCGQKSMRYSLLTLLKSALCYLASMPKSGSLSVLPPPSSIGSSPIPSPPQSPSLNSPHLEVQFKDSTTKFYCKVYFALRFKTLRQLVS